MQPQLRAHDFSSIIPRQVFPQMVEPEAGIADLDLQKQLRRGKLIMKVKGRGSIGVGHVLKISANLSGFLLQ